MKAGSRPQYYRIRRIVQMVRESPKSGYLPNSSDFMEEFGVSRRTVARDLDFLRDEEINGMTTVCGWSLSWLAILSRTGSGTLRGHANRSMVWND